MRYIYISEYILQNFLPSDMLCIQVLTCDIINGCDGSGNWWQLSPKGVSVMWFHPY